MGGGGWEEGGRRIGGRIFAQESWNNLQGESFTLSQHRHHADGDGNETRQKIRPAVAGSRSFRDRRAVHVCTTRRREDSCSSGARTTSSSCAARVLAHADPVNPPAWRIRGEDPTIFRIDFQPDVVMVLTSSPHRSVGVTGSAVGQRGAAGPNKMAASEIGRAPAAGANCGPSSFVLLLRRGGPSSSSLREGGRGALQTPPLHRGGKMIAREKERRYEQGGADEEKHIRVGGEQHTGITLRSGPAVTSTTRLVLFFENRGSCHARRIARDPIHS